MPGVSHDRVKSSSYWANVHGCQLLYSLLRSTPHSATQVSWGDKKGVDLFNDGLPLKSRDFNLETIAANVLSTANFLLKIKKSIWREDGSKKMDKKGTEQPQWKESGSYPPQFSTFVTVCHPNCLAIETIAGMLYSSCSLR